MVLATKLECAWRINADDALTNSQRAYVESGLQRLNQCEMSGRRTTHRRPSAAQAQIPGRDSH
jgi:hypothetical protein